MKLNKIQQDIYDEYRSKGKVWAECPRQAGKTELLLLIAEQELRANKKIMIRTFSRMNLVRVMKLLRKKLGKDYNKFKDLIISNETYADVVFYDEIYFDLMNNQRQNQKIVCLRTPLHKTLRFNYTHLSKQVREKVVEMKQQMSKEQFDIEFNGV